MQEIPVSFLTCCSGLEKERNELIRWGLIVFISLFKDDARRGASVAGNTGTAMPRLPSCCPQHSPCSGPSQGHPSLGHGHSSCLQQQQHGHPHHFQHHHHHHHHNVHSAGPQPPLPIPDSSCPLERPTAVPAPCGASSGTGSQYHDQVSPIPTEVNCV